MASRPLVEPQFVEGRSGHLFLTLRRPSHDNTRSVVLLLPPFAEEMNKSRRLFTLQAQTLCEAGFAVAVFDPFGTGDSEGDFGQTSIEHWQQDCEDILLALKHMGFTECIPLGVRFGALLLDHVLMSSPIDIHHAILWQPVTSGAQSLNQFLRLQSAANMMSSDSGPSVSDMQTMLSSGESVEVAGYEISPQLYAQTQTLKLDALRVERLRSLDWFAIANSSDAPMPAAAARHLQRWTEAGLHTRPKVIEGAQFWAATEIVVVPELVARSTAAVTSGSYRAQVASE